jgi:Ca2+-binding EF-hand superfamily protein
MADQASRVLRGLAKMSVSEKKTIQDIAIVAREAIEKLPHGDNNLFLNFDIHRKGHVTRQDFQNILLSKTTTSKSEVDSLTDAIDSKNTGVINYTNISESLLKIEKEKYLSSSASLPSPVTYQQSSDNEVSKAPDDTVSNVHNAAIRFEGENNVIKEIDGYERAYLLGLKYSKDLKEKFSSKTSSTEIIPQVHDCYKGPPVRYFVGHEGSKRNLESADFQTTLIPGNGNKTYFNCDESKGSEIKSSYRPLSSHVKLSEAISSDSKQHLVLYKGNNKVYHNYESNEFQKSFHAEELRSHVPERMRKRSASAPPSRSKSERPFEDGTQNSSLMAYIKGETKPKPAKIMQEKPAVKHSNQYSQLSSQNVKESLEESTDNIANDNRPKIPEFNKKHVLNSVLSQVGSYGALSVMQFRLSNRDVSNSGYLNNDEFRTALASSGVHLPKHEMDGLFENYSTNLTQPKNSTSLEFLSNKKALNIGEFMQVLKERSSAHVIAKNTIRSTPLAMEEKKIWKKVSNALREPVVSSKHSLDFFRDIQIANKNKVHPNKLHEELNFLGSKLSPQEFSNLLTSIKTDKEGYVDMNKFVKRIDESFQENNKSDSSGLTLVSDDNKVIQHIRNPSKKRHYKFHSNNSDSQTINETYSNKNTTSPHCVPSCLQISDGKEFVDERLKWTKLCNQIQDKKTSIAKAFQSEELYDKPMSPIKLRDTLYKIGVIVGDDDFKMLHSHAVSSSRNSTDDKGVTLNSLCESVGISVTKTDSKKQSTGF